MSDDRTSHSSIGQTVLHMPHCQANILSWTLTFQDHILPSSVSILASGNGSLGQYVQLDGSFIEHAVDQTGIRRDTDCPAHQISIKAVNNGRQIDLSGRYWKLRYVREPFLIWALCMKVPVNDVLDGQRYLP